MSHHGPAFAAVIGDPVAHSLSPAIHNAAFAALGIDARFEAITVPVGGVPAVVHRMRDEGWIGMSVTMPHKETVVAELDATTPIATRLGAVNCVCPEDDRLVGDNTDGAGVVWALRHHLGIADLGTSIAVIGAGGAARACVAALGDAGAADLVVVNRTPERAHEAAALAPGVGRVGSIEDLPDMRIVINATPVGMQPTDGPPVGFVPGEGVVAMDLIYHPAETPWLARARANGAVACNGVPMLVGQAAAAFERWTGVDAPVAAMTAAVATALGRSS
ncbi:MAG: shikimate dehydrogenase [Acidimicrobiales bacterium]